MPDYNQASAQLLPEALRKIKDGNTFFSHSLAKQHREHLILYPFGWKRKSAPAFGLLGC
jgi:hypothetical protein